MKNNYLKMPSKWLAFFDIIIDTSKLIADAGYIACTDEYKLTQVQLESVIGKKYHNWSIFLASNQL